MQEPYLLFFYLPTLRIYFYNYSLSLNYQTKCHVAFVTYSTKLISTICTISERVERNPLLGTDNRTGGVRVPFKPY